MKSPISGCTLTGAVDPKDYITATAPYVAAASWGDLVHQFQNAFYLLDI